MRFLPLKISTLLSNWILADFFGKHSVVLLLNLIKTMQFSQLVKCDSSAQCLKIIQSVPFEFSNFLHSPPIFVLSKLNCLVTLFNGNIQVFKNSPKLTIFGISNQHLSTQNVNVARFARNFECNFLGDFQPPCKGFKRDFLLLFFLAVLA